MGAGEEERVGVEWGLGVRRLTFKWRKWKHGVALYGMRGVGREGRERGRQTDRQINRDRDRQIEKQTDRETERERETDRQTDKQR